MIIKLPKSEGSVLGMKISGRVTLEMEKEWIKNVEEVIKEHGKIDCLVELDKDASWNLDAGIEDFKWLMTHMKEMDKIAIVSDNKFWKWYVGLDRPFAKMFDIDEKYFKPDDIDSAWKWLKE